MHSQNISCELICLPPMQSIWRKESRLQSKIVINRECIAIKQYIETDSGKLCVSSTYDIYSINFYINQNARERDIERETECMDAMWVGDNWQAEPTANAYEYHTLNNTFMVSMDQLWMRQNHYISLCISNIFISNRWNPLFYF